MPLDEARPKGFYTRVQGKIKTINLRRDEQRGMSENQNAKAGLSVTTARVCGARNEETFTIS